LDGVDQVVQGLAGDPEHAGDLDDVADLARMGDRGKAPLVDDVSAGHGAVL